MQVLGAPSSVIGSSSSRTEAAGRTREAVGLLALGALAVVLHAATRNTGDWAPGHQGVIWIGMVVLGRATTDARWAGATTAAGAAATSMMPVWGFEDPYRWLEYLIAGAVVDLAFVALARWVRHVWVVALIGGAAHTTKPLFRVGVDVVTGWPFGSLRWGVLYPGATHFAFGAIGAAAAAAAIQGVRGVRRRRGD